MDKSCDSGNVNFQTNSGYGAKCPPLTRLWQDDVLAAIQAAIAQDQSIA